MAQSYKSHTLFNQSNAVEACSLHYEYHLLSSIEFRSLFLQHIEQTEFRVNTRDQHYKGLNAFRTVCSYHLYAHNL